MFIFPVYGSLNMACQKRRVENGNNISSDEKLYLLCLSSLSEDLRPSGAEVQLQTKRAAVFQTMAEGLLTWNALFHLQTYKPPWRAGSLNSVKDRKKTLNQQTEDCRRCSETRSTHCWQCSEQTVAPRTINLNTPFFHSIFFNMSGEACGIDRIKNNCPGITEAGAIVNTFRLTCLCPDTTSLKRKNQCFSHPGTPKVRGEL